MVDLIITFCLPNLKNLDSLYGEYLRALMMNKLNDSNFTVPYIVKSLPINVRPSTKDLRYNQKPAMFIPKDIRYTDLTHLKIKGPLDMTKKELLIYEELSQLSKAQEDVQTSNIHLKRDEVEYDEQMRILEPERLKALERVERKENKKEIELVKQMIKAQKEEGWKVK